MVQRFRGLPPFWQEKAAGNTYAGAACAPELAAWALRIFGKQGGPATTPP
jgi:hypothetical protein